MADTHEAGTPQGGIVSTRLANVHLLLKRPASGSSARWSGIGAGGAQRQHLADFPKLKRWFEVIQARSATQSAYARAREINP